MLSLSIFFTEEKSVRKLEISRVMKMDNDLLLSKETNTHRILKEQKKRFERITTPTLFPVSKISKTKTERHHLNNFYILSILSSCLYSDRFSAVSALLNVD